MAEDKKPKRLPTRAEELQKAYMLGDLPEQGGKRPPTIWCPRCKGSGRMRKPGSYLAEPCDQCDGRGILKSK